MDTERREFDVPFGLAIAHANRRREARAIPPLQVRADSTRVWAFVPATPGGMPEIAALCTRGRAIAGNGLHVGYPEENDEHQDRLDNTSLAELDVEPVASAAPRVVDPGWPTTRDIGGRVQHEPTGRFGELVHLACDGARIRAMVAVDGEPRPLVDDVSTFRVVAPPQPAAVEPSRCTCDDLERGSGGDHHVECPLYTPPGYADPDDPAHDGDGDELPYDDDPAHDGDGDGWR